MIHHRYFHGVLLLAGAVLLFGVLLVGCGGPDPSASPDAKTVESHKIRNPIPSSVPKGVNK